MQKRSATPQAIGCDVGGTSCKLGLVDQAGHVTRRGEFPIVVGTADLETFLGALFEGIDGLAGAGPPIGIGVLLPGYLKDRRTVPRIMVNLKMLESVPLARMLQKRYRVKVALDIDRNGPARAEWLLHAGNRESRLLYVTIGTGLGVGLAINGKVCRVTNESVGELGHITLEADGLPCTCGNTGCIETLVSKDGIGHIADRLALCEQIRASAGSDFPRKLYSAASAGDVQAVRVFEEFGRYLGMALTSYANTFSPDAIVVGGGLSTAAELFLPAAKRWLDTHWVERASKKIHLRRTQFGMDAGVIGAASLVMRLVPGYGRTND